MELGNSSHNVLGIFFISSSIFFFNTLVPYPLITFYFIFYIHFFTPGNLCRDF